MNPSQLLARRKAMIFAIVLFFGALSLVWLSSGNQLNAQSEPTEQSMLNNEVRQPEATEAQTGTGFTYQGQLILNGPPAEPANGTYRFSFGLFDSATGGAQIGSVSAKDILVTNGRFTTILNAGGEYGPDAFTGEVRYLEISVSTDGGATSTTLTPRQLLTATPYALSLRPGAIISGTRPSNHILTLRNDAPLGNGLEINAAGRGIEVYSNGTALWVNGSSTPIWVDTGGIGYTARAVTEAGFHVTTAGTPSSINESDAQNGFEVSGSEGNGLFVGRADGAGVQVNSASVGMQVDQAFTGLYVQEGTNNGLLIDSANIGVNVGTATDSGVQVGSASTGVLVGTATNIGVLVASAPIGVVVEMAEEIGVLVDSAANGVQVNAASGNGLVVSTANTGVYVAGPVSNWAGYFTGDVNVTGTCNGCLMATFAVNMGEEALQVGDVVTVLGTRPGAGVGQLMLMDVRQAQVGDAVVGVVHGRGEVTTTAESGNQLAPRAGAAQPGNYVHLVLYGPVQVQASALPSGVQAGDKLAIDATGAARSLQTRQLDGMTISESAPTIGIALESLDANTAGLIWVLVNPQ